MKPRSHTSFTHICLSRPTFSREYSRPATREVPLSVHSPVPELEYFVKVGGVDSYGHAHQDSESCLCLADPAGAPKMKSGAPRPCFPCLQDRGGEALTTIRSSDQGERFPRTLRGWQVPSGTYCLSADGAVAIEAESKGYPKPVSKVGCEICFSDLFCQEPSCFSCFCGLAGGDVTYSCALKPRSCAGWCLQRSHPVYLWHHGSAKRLRRARGMTPSCEFLGVVHTFKSRRPGHRLDVFAPRSHLADGLLERRLEVELHRSHAARAATAPHPRRAEHPEHGALQRRRGGAHCLRRGLLPQASGP